MKESARCALPPNPVKCSVENMETKNVVQGRQGVTNLTAVGQHTLPNREKITNEGVILKSMLLVNELRLPLTTERVPSVCVSSLLKKLKTESKMTKSNVSLHPVLKVTM